MIKYNLKYEANGKIIEKRNITKEEVKEFIGSLGTVNESSLHIKQIKEIDEEER